MARKRYSDEDVLKLLREIEVHLSSGADVATACYSASISDATYYNWRKRFGGMGKSQLSEFKAVPKDDDALRLVMIRLAKMYDDTAIAKLLSFCVLRAGRSITRRLSAFGMRKDYNSQSAIKNVSGFTTTTILSFVSGLRSGVLNELFRGFWILPKTKK